MIRVLTRPAMIVSVLLLTLSAVGLQAAVSQLKLYLRKLPITAPFTTRSVPTETASWKQLGTDRTESAEVIGELGTENYLTRTYTRKVEAKGQANTLELHLAYYTGMIDTVPHVPERCIVGGGWTISGGTSIEALELNRSLWVPDAESDGAAGKLYTVRLGPNSRAPGTRVRLPRDIENVKLRVTDFAKPGTQQHLHAGYFFIANGGLTDSADGVRLLAFDLKDDYAYYLKVQVSSSSAQSSREMADGAASLIEELLPDIMLTVPDWSEVQRGLYPADNPRRAKAKGTQG